MIFKENERTWRMNAQWPDRKQCGHQVHCVKLSLFLLMELTLLANEISGELKAAATLFDP